MSYKGEKISEAVDLLVSLLAERKMPSTEVYRIAEERGISTRTLERAKQLVGVKSQCVHYTGGKTWYMSVSEEMKGRIFSKPKPNREECPLIPTKEQIISSDWMRVDTNTNYAPGDKINIPDCKPKQRNHVPKMNVKIGVYEFEVDEDFSADKLAVLLRGLEMNAV